ncbi:hypothetical protein Q7P37_007164 [Cladosporium fusiforme]
MNQIRFAHKTALITGACGGLGRAIAEAFLREGANVIVCDINADLIADFKEKTDITKDDKVDEMFTAGEKMFGGIDVVVNSAGRVDRFDAVAEMDRAVWDKVLALNLTAPAMVSGRAIRKWLEEDRKGCIVNIASIAGFRGFSCGRSAGGVIFGTAGAAYTASKHGLVGLTKSTGAFYGDKGIRCNAIAAGTMQTNIASTFYAEGMNEAGYLRMRRNYPDIEGKDVCDINKVSELVLFLSSDAASIVNGATWTADAGVTAA